MLIASVTSFRERFAPDSVLYRRIRTKKQEEEIVGHTVLKTDRASQRTQSYRHTYGEPDVEIFSIGIWFV